MPKYVRNIPIILYMALFYGFIFLPVLALVLFSFQGSTLPVPPFDGPSLQWYREVFDDRNLMEALRNSLVVGLASASIATVLALLAAYALARYRIFASNIVRAMLIAPLNVSYLVIGLGLLIMFNALSLPKSLVAVIIGHVVINFPICFAIIYSQLGERQANLERAARDLGAAEWQVLTLITIPLLYPAIFAGFALSFTLSWDEFIIALLLTRFDVTLPVEIDSLLRRGLNPKTNAIGSVVFGVSIALVLIAELIIFGRGATNRDEQ
ncbi:MAG: ABC transporter permease [Chloroflexota bacterium]